MGLTKTAPLPRWAGGAAVLMVLWAGWLAGCERSGAPTSASTANALGSAPPPTSSTAPSTAGTSASTGGAAVPASGSAQPDGAAPGPPRIVAIGDLHGDLEATLAALRLAGVIDAERHWSGGPTIVVQVGDLIDRGDGDRAILDLLERLAPEARRAGGWLHVLNGNHELMNVAGDFRYVTRGGFAVFDDGPAGGKVTRAARRRAFQPGGPYALKLARYPVILTLADTVFVHAGVLPKHVAYGIDRINQEAKDFLEGRSDEAWKMQCEWDSPVNSRHYGDRPGKGDCHLLGQTLKQMGAKRMVIGHTPQPVGIASYCGERVWAIDAGLSTWGGGRLELLELVGDEIRVLKPPARAGETTKARRPPPSGEYPAAATPP